MKIRIVFPLVACASLSTAAFAADPWDSPFTIQAGAFWAQAKTSVRLDSNGGRLGTEVNLESDLNVSDKKVSPDIEFFWRGWVCLAYDRNPHVGTTDDPTVHYALAYMGSGVALATLCGRYLAQRVAGGPSDEAGPLLSRPLPRFPLPGLRRWYQRAAYAWYGLKDEWL